MLPHLPAQSRHGLYTVEEGGVLTGVFVALVIPGRDAIHRLVLLKQGSRLTKVTEEVRRDVQVLFNDDGILGMLGLE